MARRRKRITDSIKRQRREQEMLADLRYLSKRGKRPDPTNYKAVARAARELRQRDALEKHYSRRATKRQRAELNAHGFHTTKRAVVIDAPRDRNRKKIPGAKMSVLKGGVVKWS